MAGSFSNNFIEEQRNISITLTTSYYIYKMGETLVAFRVSRDVILIELAMDNQAWGLSSLQSPALRLL